MMMLVLLLDYQLKCCAGVVVDGHGVGLHLGSQVENGIQEQTSKFIFSLRQAVEVFKFV